MELILKASFSILNIFFNLRKLVSYIYFPCSARKVFNQEMAQGVHLLHIILECSEMFEEIFLISEKMSLGETHNF